MGDLTDGPDEGMVDDADSEIANTIAEAAEAETGPEESGEQVEPEADDEPSEEAVTDEVSEHEEDDESDADDEETVPDPTPAPAVDPRDAKIEALAKRQDELLGLLGTLIGQQGKAPKPVVESPPVPDVSEDAVRFALFGGPDDARWKALTERERAAALKVQQQYVDQEVRAALNPKARYDSIREQVLKDVLEQIQPITQEFHNRQAKEIVGRHLDPIKDPEVRKRAESLFQESPGAQSTKWSDLDKAMGWAAKVALAEAKEAKAAANQQKQNAQKVQTAAAKPKLKTPGKGPGAAKAKPNKGLTMKDGESLMDFFQRNLNNEGK